MRPFLQSRNTPQAACSKDVVPTGAGLKDVAVHLCLRRAGWITKPLKALLTHPGAFTTFLHVAPGLTCFPSPDTSLFSGGLSSLHLLHGKPEVPGNLHPSGEQLLTNDRQVQSV